MIFFDMVYPVDSTHFVREGYLLYRKFYPDAYTVKRTLLRTTKYKEYTNGNPICGQGA